MIFETSMENTRESKSSTCQADLFKDRDAEALSGASRRPGRR